MKKIKLVLKVTLFCLAAALSLGRAQAQPYWTTNGWPNDYAPFGTNGNLLYNWSFELPGYAKIPTGFDTVPGWFSDNLNPPAVPDSGIQGGTNTALSNVEASYDGTWDAYTKESDGYHCRQTTPYIIKQGDCFLVSIASKNEFVYTEGWAQTDAYLSVALYYGGTTNVLGVGGTNNISIGTVGTYFFTNTFVIHPGQGSHTVKLDITNYFFGVISDFVPTNAIGQPIGIDIWQSTTQYNANAYAPQDWLDMDGVVLIPTNGIPPITTPVVLTPTNSVWGGETLTFTENAFGSTPLAYQWLTDGGSGGALTNIDGANLTNLVVVTSTNAGTYNYQLIITNSVGSVTSAVVSYVVVGLQPPSITQDTGTKDFGSNYNLFAFSGGNVNLYATFTGAPVVTNQWLVKLDSGGGYANIAGATNVLWILTNVQPASAGYYYEGATNAFGSINSTPAHLMALADPPAPANNNGANLSYSYCVYTNHPWAYWRFEETNDTLGSSMQAYDYSGHNYDATYGNSDGTPGSGCKNGGESLPQYGPIPSGGYSGFSTTNTCATMSYNHDNGCLHVPPLNLNTNTVTFTMWIYPKAYTIPTGTGLFMNRNGGDAAGIGFGTVTNGLQMPCLSYTWNSNSSATYGWDSSLFPVANVWNFVACTITPSNTVMYLYYAIPGSGTNLYKAVNNATTNAPEAFTGGTTWLGGDNFNNGHTFYGCIDEVAIFTNSLSENQLQDLFLKALGLSTGVGPAITAQPTNTAAFQGQTLQMAATASGIPNPNFQWQYLNGSTWNNLATALPSRMTTNATFYWQNFTGAFTSFRAIAKNNFGSATSSLATVTYVPVPNWNQGVWTVNFCVPSTGNNGPGTPYVGPGVLGTTNTVGTTNSYAYYWNALGGNQLNNTTSLRDDGATPSGINVGTTNAFIGTFSSGVPCDNLLLDQYAQIEDTVNGVNFFFTDVPKGIYNVALYGCTASYADRGIGFTVITNGVSAGTQWVTNDTENARDLFFAPYDNTVVFTNLLITSGTFQVNAAIALDVPVHTNSTEADFNGVQLELVKAGPAITSITNSGTNLVLTWAGGGLMQSTNLSTGAGWVTNTAVSPYTFAPTGAQRFFRVETPHFP
jgi:hypothetical protein